VKKISSTPLALLLGCSLSLGGCYTTKFGVKRSNVPLHEEGQWHAAFGLADFDQPMRGVCREGVSYMKAELQFTDGLLNVLTFILLPIAPGLFRRQTIEFQCVEDVRAVRVKGTVVR